MAERYIDGMRVFVDGEISDVPEIGIPLELVLTGEDETDLTVEVSTPEEAEAAQADYDRAQQILSLKDYVGYNALLEFAFEGAQNAAVAERSYRDMNQEKAASLRMNRIVADGIYHFLRSTVDAAELTPRPEFNR